MSCFRGVAGHLLTSFLVPEISRADEYQRAVGFFSASVFRIAGREFLEFFARGGRFRLVCSHRFQEVDLYALAESLEYPHRVPSIAYLAARKSSPDSLQLLQASFLTGQLAIKVARPKNSSERGVYHEKIGVIRSNEGVTTCFEGSANESSGAYVANYERIVSHPLRSVLGQGIEAQFRHLWSDSTPGLEVKSFVEAFQANWIVPDKPFVEGLEEGRSTNRSIMFPERRTPREALVQPPGFELREYQQLAVDEWFAAGGSGILAMATGTGKTITALSAASRVFRNEGGPFVVVIVAPLLHLVDQWIREARMFGLQPIRCAGGSRTWVADARDAVYACNAGQLQIASLAVSLATFSGDEFQRLLASLRVRTLLIVDEVHNAASERMTKAMPRHVSLRLGLSATPFGDETGEKRLRGYFGGVVFRFGLADAINAVPPILTPYTYHPIPVELDADEIEEYLELTHSIVRIVGGSEEPSSWPPAAMFLLFRRARLVAGCRSKLPALKASITPFAGDTHSLIYCGDSGTTLPDAEDADATVDNSDAVRKQIDAVMQMLGGGLGMYAARYTADTSSADRRRLEERFRSGALQALVAIKCLDEGVDLPPTRRAFILASSTNPRQFIQRRGRVLRRFEGKERADIFDFVVLPPVASVDRNTTASIKGLFKKEIARVVEFADTALNKHQALDKLRPALEGYDLQHLLVR